MRMNKKPPQLNNLGDYHEKSFSYSEQYRTLNPMDQGRLISDKSLYRFSGSTHTRYLPTELLSNSIPTGVPTGFNNSIANYSQTPYFYPIDDASSLALRFL